MTDGGNIFLDVNLPTAATWFYATLVLAVALFFQFRKPFSLRNLDVVLLFLLVPPLMYLHEARKVREELPRPWEERGRALTQLLQACSCLSHDATPAQAVCLALVVPPAGDAYAIGYRGVWRAYLFLLIGSAGFLLRCMIDLVLRRRSPFKPNLGSGGMIWLGLALFAVMVFKTYYPHLEPIQRAESRSLVLELLTQPAWEAGVALFGHALVITGLVYIGARHFQDLTAGIAAAVFYLMLPYTAFYLTEPHHVLPVLGCLGAVAFYRWPAMAGVSLGVAMVVGYFPMLLLPLWASFYFRRGMKRFLLGVAGVSVLVLAAVIVTRGLQEPLNAAMHRVEWQAWNFAAKSSAGSLWTDVTSHGAYRLPLFIAHLLLMVASVFWPQPKNLGNVLAWSVALILGVQFWYADAGGIYVLWYLPLLLLLVFRPTLIECVPPAGNLPSPVENFIRRIAQRFRREQAK
jgi:hypothetical protein